MHPHVEQIAGRHKNKEHKMSEAQQAIEKKINETFKRDYEAYLAKLTREIFGRQA